MNKITYIAIFFLSLVIEGCNYVTETEPEKTAKEFVYKFYTFQFAEAQKIYSGSKKSQIELIASNINQTSINLLKSKGEPTISILKCEVSLDNLSATVEIELTNAIELNLVDGQFSNLTRTKKQIHLIKLNGKWFVDRFNL